MKRAAVVLLPVLFAFSAVCAGAQIIRLPTPTPTPRPSPSPSPTPEPKTLPCPNVTVQAQGAQVFRDGQPVKFAANITGGDPKITPVISWNISAGAIKEGQYTRQIEVDSTGAGGIPERELVAEI